jgi:hypothetical protein
MQICFLVLLCLPKYRVSQENTVSLAVLYSPPILRKLLLRLAWYDIAGDDVIIGAILNHKASFCRMYIVLCTLYNLEACMVEPTQDLKYCAIDLKG